MFPLNDFEAHVPAKILARGHAYYQDRTVDELEEMAKGKWGAVVSGSDNYEVEVVLKGKEVKGWQCDCPYDGDICKHVVAVLFILRDEGVTTAKKQRAKKGKKTFEDILLQLDLEELRAFIRHQKAQKREFGQEFMLFFADKDPGMDIESKYRNMVRQLVKKHSDRGFMEYRNSFAFSKSMLPVLKAADHALSRNNYEEALAIAKVVCLEVMNVILNSDDSAGVISGTLYNGIQVFQQIVKDKKVAPQIKDRTFAWIDKQLTDKLWFDYGDFGDDLLDVAEYLGQQVDTAGFLRLLDKIQAAHEDEKYDYTTNGIKKRRIRFLQAIGRADEAEQLVAANMDIVEVRRNVVEKAIEQKDYQRAKQLIAEGISLAEEKDHPGTVNQWEKVLLRIAQAENDMDTYRFIAKRFAFSRGIDNQYYQIWKESFTPEEWTEVIEQHIQAVIEQETEKPKRYEWENLVHTLFIKLSPIYIAEQQWERLLQSIPESPGEQVISAVHPYLAARYPKEMLAYYQEVLDTMAKRANGRRAYQELANLMKKIKQDIEGSHATINEMVTALIQQYPRRPAMKEELERVLKK